jgi:hypothetical protein
MMLKAQSSAGAVTPSEIRETAHHFPDMRRSELFVWMSENRAAFVELIADPSVTWSALAHAFNEKGITTNGEGVVTAGTARKTWYRVRKAHNDPVGDPPSRAERAKVVARRSPRGLQSIASGPKQQVDEVAPGVRQIGQFPNPAVTERISPPDPNTNPVLERLRETMKKAL